MADPARPEAETAWERRADALFAQVQAPAPLSAAAVERIYAALDRPVPRSQAWRSALAGGGVAFLAVNAAWAAVLAYEHHRGLRPAASAVTSVPASAAPPPASSPAPTVAPPPPAFSPVAPRAPPGSMPAPRPARSGPHGSGRPSLAPVTGAVPVVAPSAAPPGAVPSTLSAESAALTRAVKALRQQRDGRSALAVLDAYAKDYPHGVLRTDAALLRVETLVALGQRTEAVALLDELAAGSGRDAPPAAEVARLRREIEASGEVKGGDPIEDE
ncbi:MAG: hypothetical protein ACYDCL_11310 [Myxococcales bacterium]